MFQRWSIRTQLLALVAVAVLPLLLYAVNAIHEQASDYRRGAAAEALSLARQIAARLDDHIANIDGLLIATGEAVSGDLGTVAPNDARLRSILAGLPKYFSSMSVLTPDGRMLNSATATLEERSTLDFTDRTYFRDAITTRGLAVGEPIQSRTSGKWILILARPLLDGNQQVRAVVSMSTQLDLVQDLLIPEGLPQGSVLTVVNQKGVVLARSLDPGTWIGRDISGVTQVVEALQLAEGSREAVAADGVARLSGFSTARRVPWLAYVGIPLEVALAREDAAKKKQVLLVFASLLVAGGCAWFLSRRIARPLKRLRQAAMRLSSGDLDHRVVASGSKEAVALADAFNGMARDLAHRSAEMGEAEERARRLSRFYAALSQANRVIARRSDAPRLFDGICRICVEQGHALMAYVATFQNGYLVPVARAGVADPFLAGVERIPLDPAVPEGRIPIAVAFREGRPYVCNDLHADPNTLAWRHRNAAIGAHATAAFPFRRGGEVAGVLSVHVGERDFFDPTLVALLAELADEISFALDNIDRDEARSIAEREAVAGFDRFQRVFRTAPMPMAISDVASGRLVTVNEAYCALFGYAYEEVIGHTSLELGLWIDPEDRARSRAAILADSEVRRHEVRQRTRSGVVLDVVLTGDVVEFLGEPSFLTVFTDITERKHAEQVLRDRERVLSESQQIAHIGSWSWELATDSVHWSDETYRIFGVAPETFELSDGSFIDLIQSDDRQTIKDWIRACLAGKPTPNLEFRAVRPDGSRRILDGRGNLQCAPDLKPLRMVGTVQDITERKRAEADLKEANQRLHALSMRLLEVQEQERAAIARELHDEIGQSLTALKLVTQSVMDGIDPARAQKLSDCIAIADHTLAQTRNLTLDLRPPQLDHLGLAATLRDYLKRIADGAGFATSFSADSELRTLDLRIATTVFRVAQEALTNAARHAGARTVAVEVSMRNGQLTLAVSDDGCGYDSAEARARSLKGGSMGILGMEERVALAGGRLRIVTRPGQGTRVQATFPLPQSAARELAEDMQ